MLRIQAMDHIVLLVADVERSVAWYRDMLGLEVLRFEEWKDGKVPFPSLRVTDSTVIDILQRSDERSGANVDHVCFCADEFDLQALVDSGEFDVLQGPVPRWGARGDGMSVYVRDPDGNTVELRHYGATL